MKDTRPLILHLDRRTKHYKGTERELMVSMLGSFALLYRIGQVTYN
jgi:hypothetical protein